MVRFRAYILFEKYTNFLVENKLKISSRENFEEKKLRTKISAREKHSCIEKLDELCNNTWKAFYKKSERSSRAFQEKR